MRPRTVEFLQWLQQRGHRVALWTAASCTWADFNARKMCQAVTDNNHKCLGSNCRETFAFVWDGTKMRGRQQPPAVQYSVDHDGCRWCQQYSKHCNRCECFRYAWECPCRHVKELRRVWNDKTLEGFAMERTLIVENTPQQCIMNYSNAIYVDTFKGNYLREKKDMTFDRMKNLIIQLETAENVRHVRKCSHRIGPHACFEQNWMQCVPTYSR